MNYKMIGTIAIIAGIIFLIWWMATRGRVKGKVFVGYQFFRHQDSPGGDLLHIPNLEGNVTGLKRACNETENCIAFNTAGYLKSSINPNNIKEYTGFPDWAGLYVKRKEIR